MIKHKGSINEDRLSDLIAQRDAAKAEYDRAINASDAERDEYLEVRESINRELQIKIFREITSLSNADTSKVRVTVNGWHRGPKYFSGSIKIDNGDQPFDDQALNWHFTARTDAFEQPGDIQFESGAWSGLDVTSSSKIESLKNSVKILEAIQKLDWNKIFSTVYPKAADYRKTQVPSTDTYTQYDNEIFMETVKDIMNNNKAFMVGGNNSRKTFYVPEKISLKTITFRVFTEGFRDPKKLFYLNNKRYLPAEAARIFKDAEIVSLNDYTEAE